ncbi:DUF4126 family protein [Mucilaginibacter aquatilis]|uniref:DUF4126 family protein n=1 Tax=Mucilaginibacter aquatilis TaxID=1517760 RepID=A0A6I4IA21_9SPHI|nr:DUF4126 family protein [Mucilaginibacter aquatilis]MVN91922.1 DUF4126 family protein [Mucilaginibacter aquatilis]
MSFKISKPFWQALSLGAIAGSRSMAAPAITSHILSQHKSVAMEHSPLSFMQSDKTATAFKLLAVAEFVGDKMPTAPNRVALPALTGRFLTGALAGASVYKAGGGNAALGALLGGGAAILSTFGSFYLRKATVKSSHILDPLIGGLEDALVVGAGTGLANAA